MKKTRILFDKTEVMMAYDDTSTPMKKKLSTANLTYDRIQSITIEPYTAKSLFSSKDSQRIVIRAAGRMHPIVYFQHVEKDHFQGY